MENRGGVGWGCSVFLVCVHPPVFKVRLVPPPPLPPAGLFSLPAAPVWTSACLQGSRLTAWPPGWCAGFRALESGFVGRVPGDWKAGRRLHGLHIPRDKKMQCLLVLSQGAVCVSCSRNCSSCPFAHFSVKFGHFLVGFQKLFVHGQG